MIQTFPRSPLATLKTKLATLLHSSPVVLNHGDKVEAEISQLKENFLSLATHELRSPLTTVLWTLDIILGDLDNQSPQSLKPKLEIIKRNAQYMGELINDILAVTRLHDNAIKEVAKSAKLPDLITAATDQVKNEAAVKNITIDVKVEDEEHFAQPYKVEVNLFVHCLHNLLTNAIRYSHPGGRVEISLVSEIYDQQPQVHLSLVDQGIGIPNADQPHIFEKFYRGKNVIKESVPGSGLGLFVVQSIIDRWHGAITVTSQEDQGTKVDLYLPLPLVTEKE